VIIDYPVGSQSENYPLPNYVEKNSKKTPCKLGKKHIENFWDLKSAHPPPLPIGNM